MPASDYKLIKQLGAGTYGQVYQVSRIIVPE